MSASVCPRCWTSVAVSKAGRLTKHACPHGVACRRDPTHPSDNGCGGCDDDKTRRASRMAGLERQGDAARDEGIARAERGAPAGWVEDAAIVIKKLARKYAFVSSDCVWAMGLERPSEPRALGPAFKIAQKLGYVVPTPTCILTLQVSGHRNPMRVWRSLLCGKGQLTFLPFFKEKELYSRQAVRSGKAAPSPGPPP